MFEACDQVVNQNHKILEHFQFSGEVKIIKEPWSAFATAWSRPYGGLEEIASRFC
jgi:hypothetical protein